MLRVLPDEEIDGYGQQGKLENQIDSMDDLHVVYVLVHLLTIAIYDRIHVFENVLLGTLGLAQFRTH